MAQTRTIRLIVPLRSGWADRCLTPWLNVRETLGTVIIENRPGAGGNIGADAVAKAAPDGLTVGIAAGHPPSIPGFTARCRTTRRRLRADREMVRVPSIE